MSRVHGEDYSTGAEYALKVNSSGQIEINLLSGEDQTNSVFVVEQGQFDYERFEGTLTATVMGATGAAGDFLHRVLVEDATGAVTILDDTATFVVIPASTAAMTNLEFNASSANGAWKLTQNNAANKILAIGRFT